MYIQQNEQLKLSEEETETFGLPDGTRLRVRSSKAVEGSIQREGSALSQVLDSESDLLPNVYEGN